ncbi:signal peptidase I [Kordiimonas aestuarii]|uniref:signal peptidase I n=1 Tax=Kordiimonas aestuarii TaxID=1005925 RepID=UPI0021D197BA|nr:signal peptidase I [Kordiimonas aestuarii]
MAGTSKLTSSRFWIALGLVFGIALIYFFSVYRHYNIPSGSNLPTLEVGDHFLVDQFAYDFSAEGKSPKHGDVVVFKLPHRDNASFIKRIIGLPGDTVQLKMGRLYINDTLMERMLVDQISYTDYQGYDRRVKEYEETLPGGVKHRIYERTDRGPADNTPLYKVPPDQYFMMGDNRDGSADSRDPGRMGFIKENWFIGKAVVITFSTQGCAEEKDRNCSPVFMQDRLLKKIE